eukprot:scaffold47243_cov54-Phaeocystis_antarctica.AAC.5
MPNHSFCTTSGSSATGLDGGVPSGGHDTPQYTSTSRTISKAHAPTNTPSARLSSMGEPTCSRGLTARRGIIGRWSHQLEKAAVRTDGARRETFRAKPSGQSRLHVVKALPFQWRVTPT